MMKRILAGCVGMLCLTGVVSATPLTELRSRSMFSDIKAYNVGDLLTVLIVEQATAQNDVKTDVTKKSSFDLNAGPGVGSIDFIPFFGAKGTSDNQSKNQGSTSRTGKLSATMTVTVVGVKDNGDLVIEGTRVIGINGDKEMLVLTGIVRPTDITSGNSVLSTQVANAQISYRGKGAANNGGKPGWIMKFLNWVF